MRSALLLFVLCTAFRPAAAQPRLVADLLPGEEGAEPTGLTVHDGLLYFVPSAQEAVAFYTFDPATGQVTTFPFAAGMEWIGRAWPARAVVYLVGGGSDGAGLYAYAPATRSARRVAGLPGGAYGPAPENLTGAGGQVYFGALEAPASEDEAQERLLYTLGPDGVARRLLPASTDGAVREVGAIAAVGDRVVAEVTATRGDERTGELWQVEGTTARRLAGVPGDAGWLSIASTGEALLVGTTDPDTRASALYRYTPGGVFEPVEGFAGSDLGYNSLVGAGPHYVYTRYDDAQGRLHVFYGTDAAPAVRIPGFDVGNPTSYRTGTLRRDGATAYTWGFEAGDDPAGSPRSFYALDLEKGEAHRLARLDADLLVMNPADYAVLGDTLYFTAYRDDAGAELFALPLAR